MADDRALIRAPFTVEQVIALNRWQATGHVHPFTCLMGSTLIADQHGWHCMCCDYRQDWAHPFMVEEPTPPFSVAS